MCDCVIQSVAKISIVELGRRKITVDRFVISINSLLYFYILLLLGSFMAFLMSNHEKCISNNILNIYGLTS